jgi:hypothetical protein
LQSVEDNFNPFLLRFTQAARDKKGAAWRRFWFANQLLFVQRESSQERHSHTRGWAQGFYTRNDKVIPPNSLPLFGGIGVSCGLRAALLCIECSRTARKEGVSPAAAGEEGLCPLHPHDFLKKIE